MIQKLHLFPGMEPVLPAGHNGQICMMLPCKCRYRFDGCQVIVLAVENTGGNIPESFRFFQAALHIHAGGSVHQKPFSYREGALSIF